MTGTIEGIPESSVSQYNVLKGSKKGSQGLTVIAPLNVEVLELAVSVDEVRAEVEGITVAVEASAWVPWLANRVGDTSGGRSRPRAPRDAGLGRVCHSA